MYTFLCNLIATAPIFPAGSCSPFNLVRWSLIEQVSLSHAPHFLLLTSQHCPLHAPVPASHFECVVLLYVFRSLSLTQFYFRCFLTDFNSHDLNQPWLAMFDCRGCTVPMTLTLKVYSTQHLPANTSECSLSAPCSLFFHALTSAFCKSSFFVQPPLTSHLAES